MTGYVAFKSTKRATNPKIYPNGYFKDKECKICKKVFTPPSPSAFYCSPKCADDGFTSAYLSRNYKIDVAHYRKMFEEQGSKCAICNREGFTMAKHHKIKLVVDHCHTSGKVRGLLCHNCNRALGLLADNTEWLENAVTYLRK